MKININRETLLPFVDSTASTVPNRPDAPILANLLINADKNGMSIAACDREQELVVSFPGTFGDAGMVTLPASKLLNICRQLPEGSELKIAIADEKATITSGRTRFVLQTLPPEDFPKVKEEAKDATTRFSIPQDRFKTLLRKTFFCMAQNDVRYFLHGVLLEAGKELLRTVATDGHRMGLCDHAMELPVTETKRWIIPSKAVNELLRLIPETDTELEVSLGDRNVRVSMDGMVFTSRLVDGSFPDYERVIPEMSEAPVTAVKDALSQCMSRVAILSHDRHHGVKVSLEQNKMRVLANNKENEQAEDEIAVEYQGEAMDIGFNVKYLLDAVNSIDSEKVRISIVSPKGGGLVLPEGDGDCRYVIMPVLL